MSRIGKATINIPESVSIELEDRKLSLRGPKGSIHLDIHSSISLQFSDKTISVLFRKDVAPDSAIHGLYRAMINNAVTGVASGFEKRLELSGVGYQAQMKNGRIELSVGYSTPVAYQVPAGVSVTLSDSTHIIVCGVDKQAVGQFAATLRSSRVPDPYKAKGVRYAGEFIKRKAGKAFGAGAK